MLRTLLCTVALFGFGAVASAGELDREAGPAKPATPTLTASVSATSAPTGSELDKESPQPAYHWHGGWGHHGGWGGGWGGWGGGWGHRGFGWGGGWGGYRGFGYGGGFGSFYRPYYGGFGYSGFYRPYYGGFGYSGFGYPGFGYSSFSIGFGRGLGWYW